MTIDLKGQNLVVIGGDKREPEILRLAKNYGATISAYGCHPSVEKVLEKPQATSLHEEIKGAHIIICPIPYPETDESLFAPSSPAKIFLNQEILKIASPHAIIITGKATGSLKDAAEVLQLRLHEYEHEDDLMILRSAAIAEGAVCVAIQNSLVSIHQSKVMLVGFGRIGTALGHLLMGMRARLYTATPLSIERARAYEIGLTVYPLETLPEVIGDMEIIFNTIPIQLFDRTLLQKVHSDALLIDIVVPPGGVDRQAALQMGINFVWARGLGTYGPRTVAKSQWIGIERILNAEL
jgi:dipicolinate synthase subunit A